ncbi:MAG: 2-dehydropantoate 2-reductase [Sphingomicrobium sp.]
MKITVIGAGAIGGWVGARLMLAGERVNIVARGSTLDRLRNEGLKVTEAGTIMAARPRVSGDALELGEQDLIVIAVKAPALREAAELAKPLIGPQTLILPMLNGVPWWFLPGEEIACVDPEGAVLSSLPYNRIIGCVVHASCSRIGPNHVAVKQADRLILGEPAGGPSERVSALAATFRRAGIRVEESNDVRKAIWYKLWGNATTNPISALTRATVDRIHGDPGTRAIVAEGMRELAALGAAIGCPISESVDDRITVAEKLGAFRTSMLQDVDAGRTIELEALLGAPIEIARRRSVPVPALERIYALTRLMAESLDLL